MMKRHSPILAFSLVALLCACNPGITVSSDGGSVRAKPDKITLSATGQPKAEITAAGDLIIDGKKVDVTPQQRVLLQTYQQELNGMTQDGLAIGKQGAAMAGKAVAAAIKGAISGDSDQVEAKIEADARLIEQQALKLCDRLVVIKGAQDRLAVELPVFAPYANIDMGDVADCTGSDSNNEADIEAGKEVETEKTDVTNPEAAA